MKNNRFALILIFFLTLNLDILYSSEIEINAGELLYKDNSKIIEGKKGIEVKTLDGKLIKAKEFTYNQITKKIYAFGDVEYTDLKNSIDLTSDKFEYNLIDKNLLSENNVKLVFKNKYFFKSDQLKLDTSTNILSSKMYSSIEDNFGNLFEVNNFIFNLDDDILKGKKISLTDIQKNKFLLGSVFVDLENYKILGNDVKMVFYKDIFGNSENDPRAKSRSIKIENKKTILKKVVFTSCKQDNDKCPPWILKADKLTHDKEKQIIKYDKTWLKLYNFPVFYFPKFFHPDPSVKRQSGFLTPKFTLSKRNSDIISLPYYKVIAENKDLTIAPKFFSNENLVLETEYRQVNKNSKLNIDSSILRGKNYGIDFSSPINGHLFLDTTYNFNSKNNQNMILDFQLQQTSKDDYINTYNIKPRSNNKNLLENKLRLNLDNNDYDLDILLSSFEKTNIEKNSDKYEYIFPEINFNKNIQLFETLNSSFSTFVNKKKYNTNVDEAILINDFLINSNFKINNLGMINNYNLLIKNVNFDAKNSSSLENNQKSKIMSLFSYSANYPMNKKNNLDETLTPKANLMFSPNKSQDISKDELKLNNDNLFAFNRISNKNTIEGGTSLTIGADYNNKLKGETDLLLNFGQVFRLDENEDLPLTSSLNERKSDFISRINLKKNNYLNITYDTKIDNNFKTINSHYIESSVNLKKLKTSFSFLEENAHVGNENFYGYDLSYDLGNKSLIKYSTRFNKKFNIREYYDIIYQYYNDCLTAEIGYNKDFYSDSTLGNDEKLFFTISIKPFSNFESPNLK